MWCCGIFLKREYRTPLWYRHFIYRHYFCKIIHFRKTAKKRKMSIYKVPISIQRTVPGGAAISFLVIFTCLETFGNQTDSINFFSQGDPRRAGSSNRVVSMNISRAPWSWQPNLFFSVSRSPQAKSTGETSLVQHFHHAARTWKRENTRKFTKGKTQRKTRHCNKQGGKKCRQRRRQQWSSHSPSTRSLLLDVATRSTTSDERDSLKFGCSPWHV